jgi:hypothetical protein
MRLADATFLPKRMIFGDPGKRIVAAVQITLFQIGGDYRLTLVQRQAPARSPNTPMRKGSISPKN